ncbi:hypothetical protein COLSTE_00124 [Collinsella stercoris DSM 13279]|uniref:Uncharacterized protein n=1 Tax=Collinsella stercoris DSM 13279 TaxID=445975 RepID=B6G7T4_9ACTN|nr:hypothetical protein COLSTE_00124 [Collinsella stercoris DSM 13279]
MFDRGAPKGCPGFCLIRLYRPLFLRKLSIVNVTRVVLLTNIV